MPAFKRAVLATAPILFFMVPFVISMAASANDRLLADENGNIAPMNVFR